MSNATWATILVSLLIVMTLIGKLGYAKSSMVVVCHNGVWAGALLLIGTNLVQYVESPSESWLTLTLGLVFFNLGAMIARLPEQHSGLVRHLVPGATQKRGALLTRPMLSIAILVYAAAFTYYLYNIAQRYGLGTLITDPESIRAYSEVSYLESVPLPIRLLLYIGPVLFVVFGFKEALDEPFPLPVRLLALALLTASMLALLQRTNLFMGILWLMALFLTRGTTTVLKEHDHRLIEGYRGSKITTRPRNRGAFVSIVALVLTTLLAFQVLAGLLNKTGQQALSTGTVSTSLEASGLTSPFVYYTAGTVAFLQLVDSTNESWPPPFRPDTMTIGDYNPQTWGAATFSPILKALPITRPWNPIAPFIDTGVLTNVYTWLEPFYRDFRLPGIVVAMSLMGWTATWLHRKRFESERLFWIQGAVISTVFLAPFVTKVVDTLFIVELILIFVLTAATSRKSGNSAAGSARKPQES